MHRTREELEAGLTTIEASPSDNGRVMAIVVRPTPGERMLPSECQVTPEGGLDGDRWASSGKGQDVQLTIINSRFAELIAGGRDRWALAGDNLIVDLVLSTANLPPRCRLAIGTAVLQVSETPHTGCAKFVERFGKDAAAFINSPHGREVRLRGIHCLVVQPGLITVGATVRKL